MPIFKELFRPERNPADTTLSAQIVIQLPKDKNLNKGALQVEELQLYVHSIKEDVEGQICRYDADHVQRGFVCKNLQPRARDIFFGHEPFGSFKNQIIHRDVIIREK